MTTISAGAAAGLLVALMVLATADSRGAQQWMQTMPVAAAMQFDQQLAARQVLAR